MDSTRTHACSRALLGVAVVAACGGDPGAATATTGLSASAAATEGTSGSTAGTSEAATTALKFDLADGGGSGGDTTGPCENLECQIPSCPEGQDTTLRGTIFAPEGTLPLYNAVAYVPNAPLGPIPDGVFCATCKAALTGDPIVADLTDTRGEFVLRGVPAGVDVPLVITVGKWRRQVTLPAVEACADNLVDPALTRLPRSQLEGDLPRIATATGGADTLECLLRRIGVADHEFTTAAGIGRVHLYAGRGGSKRFTDELGGADFPPATALWDDPTRLARYDMVVLSCEGDPDEGNKSAAARQHLVDYADAGGRVFLSHWHNVWVEKGAAGWPGAAVFSHEPDLASPFLAAVDMTFPKGKALAEWLAHVDGADPLGMISILEGQHTVAATNPAVSTRWIHTDDPEGVQLFSFNTPLGDPPADQCGRVVDTDIHVTASGSGKTFPKLCPPPGTPLTAQEKVLMFMLFELSACLIPDDELPHIPG